MKNKKVYIIIFLSLLFIINTILVAMQKVSGFDSFVRNQVMFSYSEVTTKFMHLITFLGSTVCIITISVIIFVIMILKKKNILSYCFAGLIVTSTLINTFIKLIIARPRPEYISVIEHSFSYPSGHTMAAMTLYGFLIYLLLKSKHTKSNKIIFSIVLGLIILLVGVSRIYLGAHFASDVFGALILSNSLLLIFSLFDEKYKIVK